MHEAHTLSNSGFLLLFFIMIVTYIGAGISSSKRKQLQKWPLHRYVFWTMGVLSIAIALVGPLAERSFTDFRAHMVGHLLLGMLGPLLLALAAPITLILRSLPVMSARRVSRVLRSNSFQVLSDPMITSILNVGGLWILYTTGLYTAMHENLFLHLFVHVHVFLAGYVFTASIVYIDPIAHRRSYVYRSIVLLMALTGHGVLSKYIFANPPSDVSKDHAEIGAMIMYYGGDIVDAVIIVILFYQWFKKTNPRALFMFNKQTST